MCANGVVTGERAQLCNTICVCPSEHNGIKLYIRAEGKTHLLLHAIQKMYEKRRLHKETESHVHAVCLVDFKLHGSNVTTAFNWYIPCAKMFRILVTVDGSNKRLLSSACSLVHPFLFARVLYYKVLAFSFSLALSHSHPKSPLSMYAASRNHGVLRELDRF